METTKKLLKDSYQLRQQLVSNFDNQQVWLAKAFPTQSSQNKPQKYTPVIINLIQHPQPTPQEIKAILSEFSFVQSLNHPSIPQYIDCFQTDEGVWIVQKLSTTKSLTSRQFSPDEIKKIAIAILEGLVYLQSQTPSIIHGQIRPEYIFIDPQLHVYLTNLAFYIGSRQKRQSFNNQNEFSFMAPEQRYGNKLSDATDLYGLGVTLIFTILQGTNCNITSLVNPQGKINFKQQIPTSFSPQFIDWLDALVQINQSDRFPNAKTALEKLQIIEIDRLPEVQLSPSQIEIKSTKRDEEFTKTIKVINPMPDTTLQGKWIIAEHPSDPILENGKHAWISIQPLKFKGNHTSCYITINTKELQANKIYRRQLLLYTNTSPEIHPIDLTIQTADLQLKQLPVKSLALIIFVGVICGWLAAWTMGGLDLMGWGAIGLGTLLGFRAGWALAFANNDVMVQTCIMASTITAALATAGLGGGGAGCLTCGSVAILIGGFMSGFILEFILSTFHGKAFKIHRSRGFSKIFAFSITFFACSVGICLGIGSKIGFINYVGLAAKFTGIALATMLFLYFTVIAFQIVAYSIKKQRLIKS
jgi:serine/threonine protein kinase